MTTNPLTLAHYRIFLAAEIKHAALVLTNDEPLPLGLDERGVQLAWAGHASSIEAAFHATL
jgi:hypothetical protein